MKKGDLVLVGLLVVAGFFGAWYFWLRPVDAARSEIIIQTEGEQVAYVFPLREEGRSRFLTVTGPVGKTVVELAENRVRVIDSDCPDKVCVHMGWISRPGAPIACLPNRVLVFVRSTEPGDIDFIN